MYRYGYAIDKAVPCRNRILLSHPPLPVYYLCTVTRHSSLPRFACYQYSPRSGPVTRVAASSSTTDAALGDLLYLTRTHARC